MNGKKRTAIKIHRLLFLKTINPFEDKSKTMKSPCKWVVSIEIVRLP